MTAKPTPRGRVFITPLTGSNLLTPGEMFRHDELHRRVLSLFWQDCCGVPELARAPAPIVELSGAANAQDGLRSRLRAWWVLNDGIIEEAEGPYADRLALFFGVEGGSAQLWPHYQFSVAEAPFKLEIVFHLRAGVFRRTRIGLESCPGGWVRVNRIHFSNGAELREDGRRDFDLGPMPHP
jgi:hypothetical protein